MDPFRSIETECGGDISESQERIFRVAAFLGDKDDENNDNPNTSATSADVDGEDNGSPPSFFLSASPFESPPHLMLPADAAIQICSPPSDLSAVLAPLSLGDTVSAAAVVETDRTKKTPPFASEIVKAKDKSKEKSPPPVAVKEEPKETDKPSPQPSAAALGRDKPRPHGNKNGKKQVLARRRKSGGAKIAADNTSPAASPTAPLPPTSALASRKLPSSLSGQQSAPTSAGASTKNSGTDNQQGFPANLLEVIKAFSGKPDRRFADTDILEIAKMKGIEFPNPPWWRPGGYSDDDDD